MTLDLDIPFRGLVEQSLAGMYVIQDEIYQYVNATYAGMLGYTPEEMIGMHLRQSMAPDMQDEVMANYHRRVSGQVQSIRYFTRGMHKDGHPVELEVHGSNLLYRGRPAVVGVGINITDQIRQQTEIRLSRERLRELAAHLNTVREEQRARIARELHDVLGGMLTSMKMDIQRINRRTDDPEMKSIVSDLLKLVQESIGTVRTISEDLRPGVLDHLGLREALQSALSQFARRTEIVCKLSAENFDEHMPPARETAVYRICQEALTNIARHAEATQVDIRLQSDGQTLTLEIDDNGRGMANASTAGQSIGLVSMAERAREFGGSLEIRQNPTGGISLQLNMPLED
jgi:PAS domain S-box-containing protein